MARRVTSAAEHECWLQVRAKAAVLPDEQVEEYLWANATLFANRHVRPLTLDPNFDSRYTTDLIQRASSQLVNRLRQRLATVKQQFQKAA